MSLWKSIQHGRQGELSLNVTEEPHILDKLQDQAITGTQKKKN